MNTVLSALTIVNKLGAFARIPHQSPVQVLIDCKPDGMQWANSLAAVSRDISRSGMSLFTTWPINVARITVRFVTPTGVDITQKAQVVQIIQSRDGNWEYNLEFENLLPESALPGSCQETTLPS